MFEWIRTAQTADLIFYGLLVGLTIGQGLVLWVWKLQKESKVREYVESGFVAIVLALVIRTLFVQAFEVPSESMVNTLLIGDHLLVGKFIYGTKIPFTDKRVLTFKDPQRGDIIVFKSGFPPPKDIFIKRCIGVPGDTIQVKDKILYVNGKPQVEPYVINRDDRDLPAVVAPRDNFGPITVPAGKYFMMGDNRDFSYDSRFWGFVPRKSIQGQAWVIYWPLDRWRTLK
jgi:signal peptidase I